MITDIRVATRQHLLLLDNTIETSWEGGTFTPTNEVEYQSVHLLTGGVDDFTLSFDDNSKTDFILQVTLRYPTNKGMFKIEEKTEAIVNHFKRGTKLTKNGIIINIDKTPTVHSLGVDGDREIKIVSIPLNVIK